MNKARKCIIAMIVAPLIASACAGVPHYNLNPGGPRVKTGLEKFISGRAKKYRGKRAALVTNHSGYDSRLRQNIRLLRGRGIDIAMVFEPEHGLYGYKNDIDYSTGWYDRQIDCRVYNLYGISQAFLRNRLRMADIVIFDIQDMGMRCYTYITNLKDVMDAMDGLDGELIVLDRPNPTGFLGIDGSPLEKAFTTRHVSAFPAPFLFGMTIGEAARYYRGEFRPGVKLRVIRMGGYRRGRPFHKTGLPWVPPSPNLPTYESSIVYTAIVLMEGINLSLGRGTTKPFEYIGAPWIEPVAFCTMLEALGLDHFRFKPVYFRPTFSTYAGMRCGGAQIFYTGGIFSPTEVAYKIIAAVKTRYRAAYWVRYGRYYDIDALAGTDRFRIFIQEGRPWKEFRKSMDRGIKEYKKRRRRYLLY
ncbi:MAG: DUF1343 domain-containing protein [Chrysiogenales bacterium]|nr:MAG: DUF1343 domain-containing protein [Chrysiogenales bacterium]